MKSNTNPEFRQEVNEFFQEYEQRIDNVLDELGMDSKQVSEDESSEFLRFRDELLNNFEQHLLKNFAVLKDAEEGAKLCELLNSKIDKLNDEEDELNKEMQELLDTKENLRKMLDVKSNLVKEGIKNKKEIERICSGKVKEEFVSLCKFMNLKFQWDKETDKTKDKEKKFSIIFLSDSSEDFTQVKKVEIEKLLQNDEQYLKRLRDQFKIQVQQIIK